MRTNAESTLVGGRGTGNRPAGSFRSRRARDWGGGSGAQPQELEAAPVTCRWGASSRCFLHPADPRGVTRSRGASARSRRRLSRASRRKSSPEVTLEEDLQRRDLTAPTPWPRVRTVSSSILTADRAGSRGARALLRQRVGGPSSRIRLRVLRVRAGFAARYRRAGVSVSPMRPVQLMQRMTQGGRSEAERASLPERGMAGDRACASRKVAPGSVLRDPARLRVRLAVIFPGDRGASTACHSPRAWHPEIDTGGARHAGAASCRRPARRLRRRAFRRAELMTSARPARRANAGPSHHGHEEGPACR